MHIKLFPQPLKHHFAAQHADRPRYRQRLGKNIIPGQSHKIAAGSRIIAHCNHDRNIFLFFQSIDGIPNFRRGRIAAARGINPQNQTPQIGQPGNFLKLFDRLPGRNNPLLPDILSDIAFHDFAV